MQPIILLIHIIICVAIVGLVLLQQGKGAQMGAAFGSGASQTLFGSRGPAGFLLKLTSLLLVCFFATCLTLGFEAAKEAKAATQLTGPMPVASTSSPLPEVKEPASRAPTILNGHTAPAVSTVPQINTTAGQSSPK